MSIIHICNVPHETSRTHLPYGEATKNIFHRFIRCFRHWCMVWRGHPHFSHYYRSTNAYLTDRKSHALSKSFYIIHPLSRLSFTFEIFFMISYPFALIFYPLEIAFDDLKFRYTNGRHIVEEVMQVIFFLEILVRFFMGRANYRLKEVTINHQKILKSYIGSIVFIGDVCGALPVTHVISFTKNSTTLYVLAALRFLKILRLRSLIVYTNETLMIFHLSRYKEVLNFVLITTLVVHWFTCAHYGIRRLGRVFSGDIEPSSSRMYSSMNNYTSSIYIVTAFRTMGMLIAARRDMVFHASLEHKVICPIFLLFGRLSVLVLGVRIMKLTLKATQLETEYRGILGQLNEFMNRKKLPLPTRNRLLAFYEYKFQGKFVKEAKIENILSDRLRKEINSHTSNKLIKQLQIFEDIPTKILAEILSHLKSEVFLPNDIIISAGSPADCMYFISSGTVSVTTASGREVCHLQDGGYFGEAALVLNQKNSISNVTALEICETYRLDSKTFRHYFRNNLEVFQKLKAEAEKRDKETMKLEEEFQEKLFLRTFLGERRRVTFESAISEDEVHVLPQRRSFEL